MKHYLLFVSLSYSYSILRPIQEEVRRRGDDVAWYIEDSCKDQLREGEKRLYTIQEVMNYNPVAIFAPGNYIYDFFPGIKVEVFHGLYYKRTDFGDHYKIRGLFDLYCTTSGLFTPTFKELERKYGFFKVAETGWSKFDMFRPSQDRLPNEKPVVLYAPTFSRNIESASVLYDEITRLLKEQDWEWLFSFHPKMDQENIERYKQLAAGYPNATFVETEDKQLLFDKADVMLSDSSSVIYEFLWFDKPVVTYNNTFPAPHLINIDTPTALKEALERGMSRDPELMTHIRDFMNQVHPLKDGKASARILDAVDDFVLNYQGKIKKKPLNLFRKLQLRKKAGYFPFGKRIRPQNYP